MIIQGERFIEASRDDVWSALNDPEVLKYSIPGCDEIEKTSGTTFTASVVQKVGPVKARFKGSVELSDIVPAKSYTITGDGKGGAAGFARGGANIQLHDQDGGTLLTYEAEARVGGKLAQIGNRLIDGFARKVTEEFFSRFQSVVEGGAPEAEGKDQAASESGAENGAENGASTAGDKTGDDGAPVEKKKSWLRRMVG